MTPPAPIVEPSGFTFVEEDDVAFSLRLCREVHILYGDYQDGLLSRTDQVMAGLTVTVEMLAALSRTVHDGMPAMRVTVAAAQTREMLAVMFGRDPLERPLDRRFRARYRAMVDQSATAYRPSAGHGTVPLESTRPTAPPEGATWPASGGVPALTTGAAADGAESAPERGHRRRTLLGRLHRRR